MKKKHVFALSVLLLLGGAGVTFGVKNKNKKEAAIQSTERKLDSLQKQYADGYVFYSEQMTHLEALKDKEDSLATCAAKQIGKTVDDLYNQWNSKVRLLIDELGIVKPGHDFDWEYPENMSTQLLQELYFLTGNKSGKFPMVSVNNNRTLLQGDLVLPAYRAQVYYDAYGHTGWQSDNSELVSIDDLEYFFRIMRTYVIPVMLDTVNPDYVKDGMCRYPKNTSPEYVISVLNALQCFIDVVDNSASTFNPNTLKELEEQIVVLRKELCELSLNQKNAKQIASSYENASKDIKKQIYEQQKKLKNLNNSAVSKRMFDQRRRQR